MKCLRSFYSLWLVCLLAACNPPSQTLSLPAPSPTPLPSATPVPLSVLLSPYEADQLMSFRVEAQLESSEPDMTMEMEMKGHYATDPRLIWVEGGSTEEPGTEITLTPVLYYADGVYYEAMEGDIWWGLEVPPEMISLQGHAPLLMNQIASVQEQLEVVAYEEMNGYATVHLRADLDVVQRMFDQEARDFDSPQLDKAEIDLWVREQDGIIVRWDYDIGGNGFNSFYLIDVYGQQSGTFNFTALGEPVEGIVPAHAIVFPEGSEPTHIDASSGTRDLFVATDLSVEEATVLVSDGLEAQGFVQEGGVTSEGEIMFRREEYQVAVRITEGTTEEFATSVAFRPKLTP